MPRISKSPVELRKDIMEACIEVFNEKGLKFTMDDVAKSCHISKKTVYLIFADKEQMVLSMLDYCFDAIKVSEQKIYNDKNLSTVEKVKKILIILPDRYKEVDFTKVIDLKDNYPELYKRLSVRLESDWDMTIELLERGIEEGVIRNISIPVLKAVVSGAMESLLGGNVLKKNKLSYTEALEGLIDIVMNGIAA